MEGLYKYNHKDYPNFTYDSNKVQTLLSSTDRAYGRIMGRFQDASLDVRNEVMLSTMTEEVVFTAEIEGHRLDPEDVRNSIRKSMGFDSTKKRFVSDSNVGVLIDSVAHKDRKLSHEVLFHWHRLFFPNGNPDDPDMPVGDYTNERMVIRSSSGKIVYMAPPLDRVRSDMNMFLMWFNSDQTHPFIKEGIAHLWFEIIHPFADGNGRIGRAIIDTVLAKEFDSSLRSIGISSYLSKRKKDYYSQLEYHSKGGMDVTEFVIWFLQAVEGAIQLANDRLDSLLRRDKFWAKYGGVKFNSRQIKVINTMLSDDFDGVMTIGKWSIICKTSFDSASRDIEELLELKVLEETTNQKRNKKFRISDFFG